MVSRLLLCNVKAVNTLGLEYGQHCRLYKILPLLGDLPLNTFDCISTTLLSSLRLRSSERSCHCPAIIVRSLSLCSPLSAIRYAPPSLSGATSFMRVCSVFHAAWHGVVRDGWCWRHHRPVLARVLAPLARVRLVFSLPNPLPLNVLLPPFFLSA